MLDGDARASRRSRLRGPDGPRLLWMANAGGRYTAFSEPLVTAEGHILIAGSGRAEGTVVLDARGAVRSILEGVGRGEVTAVLLSVAGREVLVTSAEAPGLVALAGFDGTRRWSREMAQRPEFLRGTPNGDVLVFSREDRFRCVSRHGAPRWSALHEGLGAKGVGLAAFDGQGQVYLSESALVFRRGPEVLWQSGVSGLSPTGEERFASLSEPSEGADLHATQHLWGLDAGVVLFGREIRCLEPSGETRWVLCRAEDFARILPVEGTTLRLGWDPRLVGGPCLVSLDEGGLNALAATVDDEGNAYACVGRTVFSVDREGQTRWTYLLPDPAVGGPVLSSQGVLLVRGPGKLFALG